MSSAHIRQLAKEVQQNIRQGDTVRVEDFTSNPTKRCLALKSLTEYLVHYYSYDLLKFAQWIEDGVELRDEPQYVKRTSRKASLKKKTTYDYVHFMLSWVRDVNYEQILRDVTTRKQERDKAVTVSHQYLRGKPENVKLEFLLDIVKSVRKRLNLIYYHDPFQVGLNDQKKLEVLRDIESGTPTSLQYMKDLVVMVYNVYQLVSVVTQDICDDGNSIRVPAIAEQMNFSPVYIGTGFLLIK
jgi:hypothetical protein